MSAHPAPLRSRLVFGLILLCTLASCASLPDNTRMTVADIDDMAAQMAQGLAASPAITDRTPASPPWIISIDKVRNLSTDVMTSDEQWAIIAKIRGSLPITTLANQRNIHFILPPERVAQLKKDLGIEVNQKGFARSIPTHELTATFRSITRAQAGQRTDLYYCQFQLIDLRTGQLVWSDKVEFKRRGFGQILN